MLGVVVAVAAAFALINWGSFALKTIGSRGCSVSRRGFWQVRHERPPVVRHAAPLVA
jgi:hypothetical protein